MIYCVKCGASLPDDARFCSKCGTTVGGAAPSSGAAPAASPGAASSAAPLASAGAQELKCPSCGAPIHPVFGEMVISCDYCGGSVTLGGQGWKEISKHTLLPLKVPDQAAALKAVHDFLDTGFMHRHAFEESKIVETKLSYVPFWVVPASASTTYQYQAVVTSVGATVGTMAAAGLIGSALGGRRGGGFTMVPILAGPVVNPTRSETTSAQYEFPVVAVKAMSAYQPKDYQFSLTDRQFFDKKAIPEGSNILNGDLGEDAAQGAAKAYVEQLQSDVAHKKHGMISNLRTEVNLSEAELLHVPLWYFTLERKGEKLIILVDGNAGRVIRTVP
jgi:zinc ribbon protein